MGMSGMYGGASEKDATAVIHRALGLGVTMLDTSDAYGPLTNEQLIGRAIAPARRGRDRHQVQRRARGRRPLAAHSRRRDYAITPATHRCGDWASTTSTFYDQG